MTHTTKHFEGKLFEVFEFLNEDEVNEFLENNSDYGVLFEDGTISVAHKNDQGKPFGTELNYFKQFAQGYSDHEIHNGELWLFFDNKKDFWTAAEKTQKYGANRRGFKSPEQAPQQLEYTLLIEGNKTDYFQEKEFAKSVKRIFDINDIDYKKIEHFFGTKVLVTCEKNSIFENFLDYLNKTSPVKFSVEKHHCTDLLYDVFEVTIKN